MTVIIRSLLFNAAFYLVTMAALIFGAPAFLLFGQRVAVGTARLWARVNIFLLRTLTRIRVEFRGLENVPAGASIVAAKHQSALETFALMPPLAFPTFVIKRELVWIPLFGIYTIAAGLIHVNRGGGSATLRSLVKRAREEAAKGREIIIFPEGTRRAPGADPNYHYGVTRMYTELGVPVVPVALNTGLFWPRRKFRRYPGTVVIEFLPPIKPGLPSRTFMKRLPDVIETASDKLLAEAADAPDPPPIPAAARARLAAMESV